MAGWDAAEQFRRTNPTVGICAGQAFLIIATNRRVGDATRVAAGGFSSAVMFDGGAGFTGGIRTGTEVMGLSARFCVKTRRPAGAPLRTRLTIDSTERAGKFE